MGDFSVTGKPYTVTYLRDGVKQTYRRVPPPKAHDALPTDVVKLTSKHSDDFEDGDKLTVKSISPRHPNVIQVENSSGQTTFVSAFEFTVSEYNAPREGGKSPTDAPGRNRYLRWP